MTAFRPGDINPALGHVGLGILGVYKGPQEVVGVFPELSATVQAHSQEIKFFRGDSFDIDLQLQNEFDPPSNSSLDGAVVRFAAKQGHGVTNIAGYLTGNEGALIIKRSYDDSEIEFINATNGRAKIKIRRDDTFNHPLVPFVWDIEVAVPIAAIPIPVGSTVCVMAGGDIIMDSSADFSKARPGDIIEVQGRRVLILNVIDPRAIQVDFIGWTTDKAADYCLFETRTRTVASGPWTAKGDVIR